MLFMVIEHFHNADPKPIYERFSQKGRMMPDDVQYHGSWIDPARLRCFQIMEAPTLARLSEWTDRWDDLIDFEIVSVVISQQYWSSVPK